MAHPYDSAAREGIVARFDTASEQLAGFRLEATVRLPGPLRDGTVVVEIDLDTFEALVAAATVRRGASRKDAPRTEGMTAEAKRRGVTVWQVRKERGATSTNLRTARPGRLLP